jgi:hypothetical protein
MTDRFFKHFIAGSAALIALITYFITVAPTVSFWDCGEFIASAHTLGIPHPPGRPFYVLFVKAVMVLLPMVEEVAKRVNYISAFFSAATVYLMVLFVWHLLSKLTQNASRFIFAVASLSAGLLLMFADTFWFNAVEAEVYNIIMFVILLNSYIALLYLDSKDDAQRRRYLIFICYFAFLGVGLHHFAMLIIPAIFVLVLLAEDKPLSAIISRWPLWVSGTVLCSIVYAIASFLTFALVLLAVLLAAFFFAKKSLFHRDISLSLAMTVVALIGFSTHLYFPIRSALNPIIDENNPEIVLRDENGKLQFKNFIPSKNNESWRAFYDYLERKQYGSESMISRSFYRRAQFENQVLVFAHMGYGGYQIAQYTPFKPGEASYYRHGYYEVDPELNPPVVRGSIEFPTLMMSIGDNKPFQALIFLIYNGLLLWIIAIVFRKNKIVSIYLAMLYLLSSAGLLWYLNFSDGTKPERRDHEMWTRQIKLYTDELARNGMITRVMNIPDPNELLSIQRKIYRDQARGERNSPARQASVWQNWERIQSAFASVNSEPLPLPDPVHLEVRNRDYFYSPAFLFMSLLYGLGIGFLLLSIQQRRINLLRPCGIAIAVLCGAVPLFANYKEHNRGNLWVPWDYAYNILMSCEPNAILFTNGDNDTFPLWFAQEVAGIRKDVRVVNLSLGNTDWYIKQILDNPPVLKLSYDKAGIDRSMVLSEKNIEQPEQRISHWVKLAEQSITVLARQIEMLSAQLDSLEDKEQIAKIEADLEKRRNNLQVFTALKEWGGSRGDGLMQTQYKLVVDLAMNNLDKPIHVSTTVGLSNAVGLDRYMVQKGMVWDLVKGTLMPVKTKDKDSIDIDRTAFLVDSVFKFRGLGDGTAFISHETEQHLFIYNSIYARLATAFRDSLLTSMRNDGAINPEFLERSLRYADLGIKHFSREWRNYAIAADLLMLAGESARAAEYLEKGLNYAPKSFRDDIMQQMNSLKSRE